MGPEAVVARLGSFEPIADRARRRRLRFDADGKRFLDFTSGIGVTATGHCHPVVVSAVQQQASRLVFGQINCMIPEQTLRFADALRTVTPEGLDCFYFSNSGAEAVEGSVKLAKMATDRTNVIEFMGGFHGRTTMTMTSSKGVFRAGYQPLPSGVFLRRTLTRFATAGMRTTRCSFAYRNSIACCEVRRCQTKRLRC